MKITKITTIAVLTVALSAAFSGCASNDVSTDDTYGQEVNVQAVNTAADEYDDGSEAEQITVKKTESKSSGFNWDHFLGKDKYTELDTCTIYTSTALMSLKNQNGVVAIQNKAKTVGFGSPYLAAYYYVTMDDENRNKLIQCIEQYHSDFENKKLERNDSKSFKAYGSVKVRLDWGTIKASTPNYTTTYANIGYKFKDKKPYFSITIFSTVNQRRLEGDEAVAEESINLTYYMTKAQSKDLAAKLSDEVINVVLNKTENLEADISADSDEY